jgi:hypothetical protein
LKVNNSSKQFGPILLYSVLAIIAAMMGAALLWSFCRRSDSPFRQGQTSGLTLQYSPICPQLKTILTPQVTPTDLHRLNFSNKLINRKACNMTEKCCSEPLDWVLWQASYVTYISSSSLYTMWLLHAIRGKWGKNYKFTFANTSLFLN